MIVESISADLERLSELVTAAESCEAELSQTRSEIRTLFQRITDTMDDIDISWEKTHTDVLAITERAHALLKREVIVTPVAPPQPVAQRRRRLRKKLDAHPFPATLLDAQTMLSDLMRNIANNDFYQGNLSNESVFQSLLTLESAITGLQAAPYYLELKKYQFFLAMEDAIATLETDDAVNWMGCANRLVTLDKNKENARWDENQL